MGAYLSTFAPSVPTWLYGTLLAGQYTTPAVYVNVKSVFTNTVPVDAYRGAGRPEATYVLERIMSKAARELGLDQTELRRRNMIQPSQFPYQTPVAVVYDIGNYQASLDKAIALADYKGFEARRAAAKAKGKLRGVGVSSYIEACGIAPSSLVGALGARAGLYEAATIRVNPTGSVSVLTGSHSHGQGHETTFAQVVADKLGIDPSQIDIVHGDTAKIPFGMGTYGSRSLAVGGAAISNAARQGHRQGQEDRRPSDGGRRERHRLRERRIRRQGHRQEDAVRRRRADGLRAAQVPARDAGAGAGGNRPSTTRRTSPIPPAPTSARSRSSRRRANSRSCSSRPPTTSATSSIR